MRRWLAFVVLCTVLAHPRLVDARLRDAQSRETVDLDGIWEIAESVASDVPPTRYTHAGPVPGLVHSALPAFRDVDRFESRSYLANMVFNQLRPVADQVITAGVSHQPRNWFWYRRRFVAPARRERAWLTVNKAQFSSEIRVNGVRVGGGIGCAASRTYEITGALR